VSHAGHFGGLALPQAGYDVVNYPIEFVLRLPFT
jgi:hypothetical protein